jgi:ankyrin repeat protein
MEDKKTKNITLKQHAKPIENQVDVDRVDKKGETALHRAVKCRDKSMLERLIKNHLADVNAVDKKGKTPLHDAVKLGLPEITEQLIDNQADVNAVDKKGKTPLHYALISPYPEIPPDPEFALELTELLLENSAKLDVADKEGKIPLHYALGLPESAKLLIRTILLENLQAMKPDYINSAPLLSKFWNTCCAEIKAMQDEKISGGFSVYDLYTRDADELIKTLPKCVLDDFKKKLDAPNFAKNFPLFSDHLNARSEGLEILQVERDKFLSLARRCNISSLINSEGKSADLNEDTLQKIWGYLSTAEIKNFIKASFYAPIKPTATISDAAFSTSSDYLP